jgi:stage II sporulation protein AA (anti-sigma F factor antagonist)
MFDISFKNDVAILTVKDDLTKENADTFEAEMDKLVENNDKIVIKFDNVNFIISRVLGFIIIKAKQLSEKNGELKIVNNNEYIDRLFSIIGIEKVVNIYKDLDEAVNSF